MPAAAFICILYCWAHRRPCDVANTVCLALCKKHQAFTGDTTRPRGTVLSDTAVNKIRHFKNTVHYRRTSLYSRDEHPFLSLQSAQLSYSYTSAAGLDSFYHTPRLVQNGVSASCNFNLLGVLPLHAEFFGRRTNTVLMPDLNEFSINLASQPLQGAPGLPESITLPLRKAIDDSISRVEACVRRSAVQSPNQPASPEAISRLLECRQQLASVDFIDSACRDSIVHAAEAYIANWTKWRDQADSQQKVSDSLNAISAHLYEDRKRLESLSPASVSGNVIGQLLNLARAYGISTTGYVRLKVLEAVKTLSIGKSVPAFSDLTVKDVPVNGVNVEYNAGKLYMALLAGTVINSWERMVATPRNGQYVYSGRLGYGSIEGNNVIVTWFGGRKETVPGLPGSYSHIAGCGLSAQFWLGNFMKLYAETASSLNKQLKRNDSGKHTLSALDAFSSNAFSIGCSGTIPFSNTQLEARWQYRGAAYRSFTLYAGTAASDRWRVKLMQSAWRGRLRLTAQIQKNDFENPFALQRYNSSTVFRSLTATFRPQRFPSLTVGYIPTSQLVNIDNRIFESHFQQVNAVVSWQYKLQLARAASYLIVNRSFNEAGDSAFLFYNAACLAFNQYLFFNGFSAHAGYSFSNNGTYRLTTLETGMEVPVKHNQQCAIGARVINLQHGEVHVTLFGSVNLVHRYWGSLTLKGDGNYLPTGKGRLARTDLYSLVYTKHFK